jgi:1-acyl-sn-glycerol-3-phosphate acyltransferase
VIASVLKSLSILFVTLAGSAATLLCGAVTRSESLPGRVMASWGRWFIRAGGWKVRAQGLEILPEGGAILVSNHQSLVDIPLFLFVFRREIRFLAKRELGEIPLFGPAMRRAGNLLIDREDPRNAVRLMREAVARIRRGQIVVVFPEGTRSDDGSIGEFKAGAFYIAHKAGVPVFPVYIEGGRFALPKGAVLFRPGTLSVRVLPPLPPDGDGGTSKERIAREARNRILEARAEEEARRSDREL